MAQTDDLVRRLRWREFPKGSAYVDALCGGAQGPAMRADTLESCAAGCVFRGTRRGGPVRPDALLE